MIFEAADREDALRNAVEEVGERAAAFGVNHGGDYFGRLIEEQVGAFGLRAEEFALDFDVVGGFVGFGA